MSVPQDEGVGGKLICDSCIREPFLAENIRLSFEDDECDYCGAIGPVISVEDLADRIEESFSDFYQRTAEEPEPWRERLIQDSESHYDWEREGTPVHEVIQDSIGLDPEPAADVLEILSVRHSQYSHSEYIGEETEFAPDSYYKRRLPVFIGLHTGWYQFEQSLKAKARFFNRASEEFLGRIFGGVDKMKTRQGGAVVVNAGPGTKLRQIYRSRVFQAEDGLMDAMCYPEVRMGPPPSKLARSGRMNAQGISVFYGAKSRKVAIAEVRPPVGSKVAVARFDITRCLSLLDLTAAVDAYEDGSIFDPSFKERLHRADFFRSLVKRMSRPVMPDDEGIDYLPTQAVADYLANANHPRLDGIIFPSVQVQDGYNVVLFHKAAKVAEVPIPAGTQIEAAAGRDSEDGWEEDYTVVETVPPQSATGMDESSQTYSAPSETTYNDDREVTLKLCTSSLEVHHVSWISIKTVSKPVQRYRRERRDP